jgi:hypothetical protein
MLVYQEQQRRDGRDRQSNAIAARVGESEGDEQLETDGQCREKRRDQSCDDEEKMVGEFEDQAVDEHQVRHLK